MLVDVLEKTISKTVDNKEVLDILTEQMKQFDELFCGLMFCESNFTIRLEVRGNKGEMLHARVYMDDMKQPKGAQKRIDKKSSKNK